MSKQKTALIVGASKGLGLALAKEFLKREWHVIGTVRGDKPTELHDVARQAKGALEIESVDVNELDQIAILRQRLSGRSLDLLFVNSGTANFRDENIGEISTEEFTRVMVTNSLSVMRVVEQFTDNVIAGGTIGIMSSGQGSVADNDRGGHEVYRASKAALNMLMRSFAARRAQDRTLLLMAPGWIKTDLGGPNAKFTIAEAIPQVADTISAQEGKTGLHYLDRFGKTVRW